MNSPLAALLSGHQRFQKKFFVENNTLFKSLVALGQQPKVMVIACSDSRVDPATLFDAQPGDLFVVRNVANLVPPCETGDAYHGTSAALEFGVCFLNVEHIVVLGHSQCGGIKALAQEAGHHDTTSTGFIAKWMEIARMNDSQGINPPKQSLTELAFKAVDRSLANLMTFCWIRERVVQQKLSVHGWYFDLDSGNVLMRNNSNQWLPINHLTVE